MSLLVGLGRSAGPAEGVGEEDDAEGVFMGAMNRDHKLDISWAQRLSPWDACVYMIAQAGYREAQAGNTMDSPKIKRWGRSMQFRAWSRNFSLGREL